MVIDYMKNLIRDLHVFADGREVARSCRMRLTARENLSLLPQLFHLEIENLSASSSVLLPSARSVEVRSGDSVLASGSPVSSCSRRQSGHSLFSLSFSPGMALWQSSVSLSLSAGMSASDSVRAVLSASGTGIPLAAFSADDAFLLLDFRDTGVGIPEEQLGRIFEPYHTTKAKGTGLGLMIVQRIVRDHGGHIEVSSKEGEGTCFRILLPRAERRVRKIADRR